MVSRQLAVFIVATHGLAALTLLLMPGVVAWGKLLLWLAVTFSGWYCWRLHIVRSFPHAVQDVTFYAVDNCLLRTVGGSRFARLDDSSFLHPWLCVLNLRSRAGKLYTLVLLPDSLPQDTLRQLRVRVKFSPVTAPKK